ncbi:hypothetical protein [Sphingobacterium faecium]|uniref:hypothetical protein n=1 Tax=Sphingobacterium faecium TaxID=34087 RepID=UPI003209951D
MPWYLYNGGNICMPNSYILVGLIPPSCPFPNTQLCSIQAIDNLGNPLLTAALICEIANALQTHTETVNVLLKP